MWAQWRSLFMRWLTRTDLTDAVTAAAAISSLGRVAPTERVDKALDKDIRDIGKKQ
jgi:hypothetical protein